MGIDKIVVTNISYKTKRTELLDFFDSCGPIQEINIPQRGSYASDDDDCSAESGIAFIKFKDCKSAASAIEKDGTYLNYRKIKVKYNQNRWDRKINEGKRYNNSHGNKRSRSRSMSRRERSHRNRIRSTN